MTDGPIRRAEDAERGNAALRDLFWFDLVARGIWFAKRGMFALSIALDDADHNKLADAVEVSFADPRPAVRAVRRGITAASPSERPLSHLAMIVIPGTAGEPLGCGTAQKTGRWLGG